MGKGGPTLETLLKLNGVAMPADVRGKDFFVLQTPNGHQIRLSQLATTRSREELIAEYWSFHPRFRFLKTAPRAATLADFGAGSGGLIFWRQWGQPKRDDLNMYALDLSKGQHFDLYSGFHVADLNLGRTTFGDGTFDGVILSHVVEHISNHGALFDEIARICAPNASIYIEWPHPRSAEFVSRSVLSQFGIATSTINFFDDPTHIRLISHDELLPELQSRGFSFRELGDIRNPYLAEEMFAYAYDQGDSEMMTYALWLLLGFSEYIVASR